MVTPRTAVEEGSVHRGGGHGCGDRRRDRVRGCRRSRRRRRRRRRGRLRRRPHGVRVRGEHAHVLRDEELAERLGEGRRLLGVRHREARLVCTLPTRERDIALRSRRLAQHDKRVRVAPEHMINDALREDVRRARLGGRAVDRAPARLLLDKPTEQRALLHARRRHGACVRCSFVRVRVQARNQQGREALERRRLNSPQVGQSASRQSASRRDLRAHRRAGRGGSARRRHSLLSARADACAAPLRSVRRLCRRRRRSRRRSRRRGAGTPGAPAPAAPHDERPCASAVVGGRGVGDVGSGVQGRGTGLVQGAVRARRGASKARAAPRRRRARGDDVRPRSAAAVVVGRGVGDVGSGVQGRGTGLVQGAVRARRGACKALAAPRRRRARVVNARRRTRRRAYAAGDRRNGRGRPGVHPPDPRSKGGPTGLRATTRALRAVAGGAPEHGMAPGPRRHRGVSFSGRVFFFSSPANCISGWLGVRGVF